MSEKKYWCWRGKHYCVAEEFSPSYLRSTYNGSGRICIKCAKQQAKEKKEQKLHDEMFFKFIG